VSSGDLRGKATPKGSFGLFCGFRRMNGQIELAAYAAMSAIRLIFKVARDTNV
jgi:hypothetical protein